MYVHGCANPIKYLYLQGHFSKRDFREMSFLLWSNNIRMEESIMTDTALRAGAQSANNTHMVFANDEDLDEKLMKNINSVNRKQSNNGNIQNA